MNSLNKPQVDTRVRLRRLAVVAGLVVAGTGAAVIGASPAFAAVINNAAAAAAGTISQVSVAACPAGQVLTGAGGWIVGGAGDVTLTDVIPSLATQTVTAWGHANPGAAPGAYVVVAQAICVPGAPPPNYQLVTSVSANNGAPVKSQVVNCPAGTNLLGLGAQLANGNGEVFYQRIQPNAALNSATVTAGASGGYLGPWQVTAYAICATPPGVIGLVAATGPLNNAAAKVQATGACPAGTITTGVGGQVSQPATGNVILDRITANAAQNAAVAGADSDGTFFPNWDLTSYNICWGP